MPQQPYSTRKAPNSALVELTPTPPRLPRVLDHLDLQALTLQDETNLSAAQMDGLDIARASAVSVEFRQCRLHRVDFTGAQLPQALFEDCRFEAGSVANLNLSRALLTRVHMAGLRMTGLQFTAGVARDLTISECQLNLSSFRFTKMRKALFTGCSLVGADFQNADLSGVHFVGCDLEGAQFSQAKLDGARFVDCVLSGIGGVSSFRGAIIRSEDLISLAQVLATELGIRIERSDSGG